MKKVLFPILALVLTLSMATSAVAAGGKWVNAQRAPLYPLVPPGSSNYVDPSLDPVGQVILVDPMGNVTFIIQGHVEGLTPDPDDPNLYLWVRNLSGYTGPFMEPYYNATYGYYLLDTFTVNEEGRGNFHVNIRSEHLIPGTYQIQVAINTGPVPTWPTVAATYWDRATGEGITVTIKSE